MSENEQFWQYDPYSGLVYEYPSEEIAIYYAESSDDIIVFVASLHDVQEYPYQAGDAIILGPGVSLDGHFITANGQIFGSYPWFDGKKTVFGPDVVLEGDVVTAYGQTFYRTCDVVVVENKSRCIMPYLHRSNHHEDKDGNLCYN